VNIFGLTGGPAGTKGEAKRHTPRCNLARRALVRARIAFFDGFPRREARRHWNCIDRTAPTFDADRTLPSLADGSSSCGWSWQQQHWTQPSCAMSCVFLPWMGPCAPHKRLGRLDLPPPVRHQHPRNQVPRFERDTPSVFHVHRMSCTSHERIHEVRSIPRERRKDTPMRRGLPSHLIRYKLRFGQGTAPQRPTLEWS